MILGHSTENTSYFLVHAKAIFRIFFFNLPTLCTLQFPGRKKSMRFLVHNLRNVNKVVSRWFAHFILKYLIVTHNKVYIISSTQMACQVLIFISADCTEELFKSQDAKTDYEPSKEELSRVLLWLSSKPFLDLVSYPRSIWYSMEVETSQ